MDRAQGADLGDEIPSAVRQNVQFQPEGAVARALATSLLAAEDEPARRSRLRRRSCSAPDASLGMTNSPVSLFWLPAKQIWERTS